MTDSQNTPPAYRGNSAEPVVRGTERTIVSAPDTDQDAAWLEQMGLLMAASGYAESRGLNFVLLENEWEGLGDGTGRWVTSYRLEEGGG